MRATLLFTAAAVVLAAGAAQASPSPRVLRLNDPVGDSSSANRGHDIKSLHVSTGQGAKEKVLVVRLDLTGPLPSENTLHEVTFRSGKCLVHLGYGRSATAPPEFASAAEGTAYDCGAATPQSLYLAGGSLDSHVLARGSSITWTIFPDDDGLPVGSRLTEFRAYASFADELRIYWASQADAVGSYDLLLDDTAAYRFG